MKKIKLNSFAVLAFVVTFLFTTFNAYANQTRENVIKDRKSTRLNSSHMSESRMPSSA